MIGRADIEGSKSNVAMNAWLPQASYPCVLSRLFDARGRPPKRPFPIHPPTGTRRPALAAEAARAVRRQPMGSGLGPPCPALRANPFPEVTDPFCRLPLPTLFHRPEAVHLGDLMRYEYDRARLVLGPPDFQGSPGAHRTPRDVRCSSSRWTLPPA
ncbi:hypothetical protein ACHQM5_031054 [Ranunculus cassubicifolius]